MSISELVGYFQRILDAAEAAVTFSISKGDREFWKDCTGQEAIEALTDFAQNKQCRLGVRITYVDYPNGVICSRDWTFGLPLPPVPQLKP